MTDDIEYMRRCFALAEQGRHTARPNPVVGCVIVREGKVVGEGWHAVAGQAHAEILALRAAGELARGATVYVSLEPCAHQGRTGPCAQALVKAGVARVVHGMGDPNPLVAGKGLAVLRAAGIQTGATVLEDEARALNPGFIKRMEKGLPYVRCKLAMSLDGRTALASGESKWITGEAARADVQRWRARSCAILTGVETLLQDDAALTVRLPGFAGEQPLRVVADSRLRTPHTARMLNAPGEVLLACVGGEPVSTAALRSAVGSGKAKLTIQAFPGVDGRVDLRGLLHFLASEKQCNEVLLEAGPVLAAAMLRAQLVDELLVYVAPHLLGSDARPLLDLHGLKGLDERIRLEFLDVFMVGKDCRMRSRVLS